MPIVKAHTRRIGKVSPDAQEFISEEIRRQIHDGKRRKVAIAIAFSKARERGYRIPRRD